MLIGIDLVISVLQIVGLPKTWKSSEFEADGSRLVQLYRWELLRWMILSGLSRLRVFGE